MKKKCPLCETENEEDARFCKKCNEPLYDITNNQNKEIAIVKSKKNNEKRHKKDPKVKEIIKKVEGIWNKFPRNVNKKQKIILTIFIPIILFFIAYTIAYYVSVEKVVIRPAYTEKISVARELFKAIEEGREIRSAPYNIYYPAVTHKYYYPFSWQKTWYVWILFLFLCGFFEYKLFEDKK